MVGIDWFLCLAILAIAFLVASFSVRNSDFFLHLASGRLLSEGGYSFGKDPFSFVGGDRTWVNHSWLFDWFLFQLYSAAGGPGVVIAKAVAVAIAAGVLLLARRSGQSVFPGVVCVGLALVASTPRLLLQPTIATILGIAILMALLVRSPKPAGSWRFPVCIAVLFTLWSNLDQWFFLGPVFLLLYIIGQVIRPAAGESSGTMWKALLLGTLACMVNPHHVRVWELPPEVVDSSLAKILADDVELGGIFRGAFTKGSLDFAGDRDNPANLYCLLGLLALGLVGFVSNYKRMSIGLALVWAGAVGLALLHLRAIPYLAFVAAPIAAMNLADALKRLTDVPRTERSIRAFLALRAVGRGLSLFAALLLVAVSYPGWLNLSTHPPRRWAWDVEPNPSMQRMAEKLKEWKEAGLLPAEARLLNLQPEFANYVAWYAPGIKSYFDTRFRFHRDEAAEYAALRKHLAPPSGETLRKQLANPDTDVSLKDRFDMSGFLSKHEITYAVTSHPLRQWNEAVLSLLLNEVRDPAHGLEWAIWHIEGRAVVLGWTHQVTIPRASFDRLRFNPLRSAYAESKPMGEIDVTTPLLAQTVWERYLTPPPVSPPEGEEAYLLLLYRDALMGKVSVRQRGQWFAMHLFGQRCSLPALNLWTLLPLQPRFVVPAFLRSPVPSPIPSEVNGEVNALSLLAVRAARRAIASSPDHPDGYYYLSLAYPIFAQNEFSQDIEYMVSTGSRTRCKVRIPEDPIQKRAIRYVPELLAALRDSHFNTRPQRLDLLLEVLRSEEKFRRSEAEELENNLDRFEGTLLDTMQKEVDARKREMKGLVKQIEDLEKVVQKNTENYVNEAAGLGSAIERAAVARRYGLVREAIDVLYKSHETYQKQSTESGDGRALTMTESAQRLAVYAELVELMIFDGRIEEAANILGTMDHPEAMIAMEAPPLKAAYLSVRRKAIALQNPRDRSISIFDENPALRYGGLRLGISMILGDFKRAIEVQIPQLRSTRKELEAYRTEHFPKGPPDSTNIPSHVEISLDILYQPTLAVLHYYRREYYRKVEQFLGLSNAFVEQQVRLGMTYLEQGDLPRAASHFRQSLETPEWKTPLPSQQVARDYLNAMEKAGLPQGGTP